MPLRVLIATIDGGGNLPPLMSMARMLFLGGHEVHVVGEPCSRRDIEFTGARFHSWNRAPHREHRNPKTDLIKDWAESDAQAGALHVIQTLICGRANDYAQDTTALLTTLSPHVVLTLDMLLGVMIACEARKQPFVCVAPNLSMFPLPGVPPFGSGLAPARTVPERALHDEVARGSQALFDSGLPSLNAARVGMGLRPLDHVFDQAQKAIATWLLTSKSFDFAPVTMPPSIAYIGAPIEDPHWADAIPLPWGLNDQRALILVSLSTSYQNQEGTLNRIAAALEEVDAKIVITLGPMIRREDLSLSENIFVVQGASHESLMPLSSLVITHGGHGTVIRALRHRRPLLILPHGRDQADNAIRVTERGAGLSLNQSAPSKDIQKAVLQLLNNKSYSDAAVALGNRINAEPMAPSIMAQLETLAL